MTVQAHDQNQTIHLRWHYPEHEARPGDPHYADFNRVRRRMEKQGLLKCVICGTDKDVQLHHSHIEFSLQNGVDYQKLNVELGLHLDATTFAAWINEPANLEPLCRTHHIGAEGIHMLPTPAWEALRVWRSDLAVPVESLTEAQSGSDQAVP